MIYFLLILTLFSSEIQTINTTPYKLQQTVPELTIEVQTPTSPSFNPKSRQTRKTDELHAIEPSKVNEQDDKWIWGNEDNKPYKSNRTHENLQASPQCTIIRPETPYFTSSVQRISEKKCAEYLPQIASMVQNHKKFPLAVDYYSTAFIGGRIAKQSEFPHMGAVGWKASVGDDWIFKCGSSLISTNFVLTAAHCTKASSVDTTIAATDPKIVRFGVENLITFHASDVVDKRIKRIIVNPQYKAPDKYNDIALMEIFPVTFTHNVYPVCLWNSFDTSCLGTQSSGAGWGATNPDKAEFSKSLQVATLDIIDTTTCENLLRSSWNRHWCGFQDHQICAGKLAGGVDSCKGDSGGPLQVKIPKVKQALVYYVIGVTSFGFGCALENSPGIYTRVSSFIDWIENNVWQ